MFNENNFSPKKKSGLEEPINERAKDLTRDQIDGTTFYDESTDHWDQPIDESTGVLYSESNSGAGEDMVNVNEISAESIDSKIEGLGTDEDPAAQLLRDAGIDPETGGML